MVRSVVPLVEEMLLLADEAMFLIIVAVLRVRKAMPLRNGLTFSGRMMVLLTGEVLLPGGKAAPLISSTLSLTGKMQQSTTEIVFPYGARVDPVVDSAACIGSVDSVSGGVVLSGLR
jgi:hypothetical protein